MVAPPTSAPVIAESPARHVLYQHFVVSMEELPETIQRSFAALYARIEQAGIIPAGPPFAMYNSDSSPWDVDICAPIAAPMTPSADFQYVELPATRIVSLVHVGPYEELGRAYAEIESYIRDKGLNITGSPREIYLSPPGTPDNYLRTILEWPIA